jgi:hypothetical protein
VRYRPANTRQIKRRVAMVILGPLAETSDLWPLSARLHQATWTDMNTRRDNQVFWDLRDAPLHLYGPEEWKSYDPAMAAWLTNPDPRIRSYAIERLATATLHWDYEHSERAAQKNSVLPARVDWLLTELENAQQQWRDVIPEFLRTLRWHGDDSHVAPQLLRWIDSLASHPAPPADDGVIRGTQLLLTGRNPLTLERVESWIALLDAPSPYLRGCAAYLLGQCLDDDDMADEDVQDVRIPRRSAMMRVIGEKEIARPGIAGPFWGPLHFAYPATDPETIFAAQWMLDLLERRQDIRPDFDEMPFNDIAFYLHELCCDDPSAMLRMIDGGFRELALMTATEIADRVDGAKPVLELLATDPNPDIGAAARAHLARFYP